LTPSSTVSLGDCKTRVCLLVKTPMVDAFFVDVPRQRNIKEKKVTIKKVKFLKRGMLKKKYAWRSTRTEWAAGPSNRPSKIMRNTWDTRPL